MYKLTLVRGRYYLYRLDWSQTSPWYIGENKKVFLSYLEKAKINKKKVAGIEEAEHVKLYHPRIERLSV